MSDTTRLALPRIDAAQAQKHVTHNEALGRLDALVHLSVSARNVQAPPAAPAEGARCLVGGAPTGLFAGRAQAMASFDDGAWTFHAPRKGWRAFVEAENRIFVFDGAAWTALQADVSEAQNLRFIGLAAAADADNPLNARLNAALFNALRTDEGGSGDLRFKLNKQQASATVSHIYQSAWSGRAETGLMGDDRYRVKVSSDGATWKEALNVDPASGRVFFPNGIADPTALAAVTGGGPAAYTLQAPPTGPLPEGAIFWMIPHAPNATALGADPTLHVYGVDSAPLPLKSADGSTLPQGALRDGRATLVRKCGQTYRVQTPAEPLSLVNLLEDGGRFAGAPDATTQTIGAFADPTYFVSVNGATRAHFGLARADAANFGGASPAMPQQIADLVSKIRSGSARLAGSEFHVLQATAGGGSAGGVSVQGGNFHQLFAAQRHIGKAQTGALYFRVLAGAAVIAPAETCPRVLVDGVLHDAAIDASSRIFTPAEGWRHAQFWIASPAGHASTFWPLRVAQGSVVLVALSAVVQGFHTLPWDIGALPAHRSWR